MPRIVYVNGEYVPYHHASVHVEDRGYQFADGVYEVVGCIHGNLADETGHLDRLERSLNELKMSMPVSRETLRFLMRECLRRNNLKNAGIYIQVTRGAAPRDFKFPKAETPQSLVIIASPFNFDGNLSVINGVSVITIPDIRWQRRDIKTVGLLPQALARQQAIEAGAGDAWMVDPDGYVTEASASNAWIITQDNKIVTRAVSHDILRGVTRTALEKICGEMNFIIEERSFTPAESYQAQEAFNSSATALIAPVVKIDDHVIGSGKPGPIVQKLYSEYRAYVEGLRGEQLTWKAGL